MALNNSVFSYPNRVTKIEYQAVSYPAFHVLRVMDNVVSCTITEDWDSLIKVTGSLRYEGELQMNPLTELVRVYSVSTVGNETKRICHGTFFASLSSYTKKETGNEGELKLFSMLQAVKDVLGVGTHNLFKGRNPWDDIRWAVESMARLKFTATKGTRVAQSDHSWDSGKDWLTISNEMLDIIGYEPLQVTEYGDVITRQYIDPNNRGVIATLSDHGKSPIICGRTITRDFDASGIPNMCALVYTPSGKDQQPQIVRVYNNDKKSPYSTYMRGREIRYVKSLSELPTDTTLRNEAIKTLREQMQVNETYELDMLFNELHLGDVVLIDYERLGLSQVKAEVVKRTTTMDFQLKSQVDFKRVIDDFDVEFS